MSKSLTNLSKISQARSLKPKEQQKAIAIKQASKAGYVKNLFNPFQLDWINDESPIAVYEKSRRIGISFAESFRAFRNASLGVSSTIYTSYNLASCKKFIENCGKWAIAFNTVCRDIFKVELIDENQVLSFSITFPNGFSVLALPGESRSLRGVEGTIVIDEAAFRDDLDDLLKAAIATVIRGNKVRIISTHYGISNPFNKLCRDIESGEIPGSLHTTTFKMAVSEGMFKSMQAIKGKPYSLIEEAAWEQSVRRLYKHSSSEELDCIPSSTSGNALFHFDDFDFVNVDPFTAENSLIVMSFDLAATDESVAKKTSFYTAFVKILVVNNLLVILDAGAIRLGASEADQWIENNIRMSTPQTISILEQEPGSSSIRYFETFKDRVQSKVSRQIESYRPIKSKVLRALPLVPMVRSREDSEFRIVISDTLRNKELVDKDQAKVLDATFLGLLTKFNGSNQPLVNDLTDSLSNGIDYIMQNVIRGY